jgi:signal peptide peptidase SppA
MSSLAHIAQRMLNVPVAIHPAKAELIVSALAERMGIAHVARLMEDDDFDGPHASVMGAEGRNPRAGYDGIRQNLLTALADPEVKGIMLDIDSPGGEVAGCFDLVDTIYKARQIKPVWAVVDEMSYSAGYAIASAATRVIKPRTGGTGSVGVVVMHADWSDAIEKSGLKVTIITYGDHKADGNPYERLPKAVQAAVQKDINTMGVLFAKTVSRNRSLSFDAVRDTQARCYLGQEGVDVGLADEVLAPDDAFLAFVESL